MSRQELTKSQHKYWALFLFHFLLFSYPLLSLLWRREYPLFTIEVGALFLLLAVLSLLLTVILSHVRVVIVNVLSPLLITIAFMLQFNFLLPGVVLCTSIGLVLAWRLRANFQIYGLPVLITLIVGAYFDSFEDDGWLSAAVPSSVNLELPPVVHILLDSFIGIEGLPPYPGSGELKSDIYSFFNDHDFQVFPYAYSRYSATGDSLYKSMNFEHGARTEYGIEALGRLEHTLKKNAEFDVMEDLGYKLNIYQTGFLDFCQSNPEKLDRCWEYSQPNLLSIEQASSLLFKVKALVKALLDQSVLLSDIVVSRYWLLDQGVATHDPRVIRNLKDDLVNGPGGRFYFAHVLLPHDPYAFMHDCSINYETPLWARVADSKGEPVQNDNIYELRGMTYFEQVDCALKTLRQLFEDMKTAGFFEDSIIVIHGDHGSRIGKYQAEYKSRNLLTPTEYRAQFSTLFAVKFPGEGGLVNNSVLSISFLLEAFSKAVHDFVVNPETSDVFMQAFPEDSKKARPYVYLLGTNPRVRVDINIFED